MIYTRKSFTGRPFLILSSKLTGLPIIAPMFTTVNILCVIQWFKNPLVQHMQATNLKSKMSSYDRKSNDEKHAYYTPKYARKETIVSP